MFEQFLDVPVPFRVFFFRFELSVTAVEEQVIWSEKTPASHEVCWSEGFFQLLTGDKRQRSGIHDAFDLHYRKVRLFETDFTVFGLSL